MKQHEGFGQHSMSVATQPDIEGSPTSGQGAQNTHPQTNSGQGKKGRDEDKKGFHFCLCMVFRFYIQFTFLLLKRSIYFFILPYLDMHL